MITSSINNNYLVIPLWVYFYVRFVDESHKEVLIRITHPSTDEEGKKSFRVYVKAPTAAILNEKSETLVLIMG